MNHSASYGTPERNSATRRFCSTPIGPGYPPDFQVGHEEDIHSFISTLDEFVEHCDTFLASTSPAHVTPRSSISSYGQPVEEGEPLPPQQCVQGGEEGEEEEDTYCEYRDVLPHKEPHTSSSERNGPCCEARVSRGGLHDNNDGERENQCLRIVEFQQASGGPPLEGLYFGPDPADTEHEQAPFEAPFEVPVEAQNGCFCPNSADCQGGPRCFMPHIECLDVDSTLSLRCAQRPEPEEVQRRYCTKSLHSSRRLDFCTFGDYKEVPGEKPDLHLETCNAYCAMKDRPPTSGGHLYHHSSASEHSASFNASVNMEGDPPERGVDEGDWQQYSNAKYDASCQMEDPFGPHEYQKESDPYPRLFPISRCPGLDAVVNGQTENHSDSTTNFYSPAACSSSSCHKLLNLSKELNRPKTEASNGDAQKATNQHLASKEASTEHPVVAVSSAAGVQSTQFSQASDPALPPKGEDGSFDASVVMEDVFARESCIDKCKWQQYSNNDPSCKMDGAFAPNECPEGSEKQKSDAYSRPFPIRRCSRQETVAAGRNEKKLEPNFYCSAAGSLTFCDKSSYSCKGLNGPETEAFNRDVPKASNQPLASKEASTKSTVLLASSAASTQCKQSTPDCDTTLPSKDKSTKLRLHQPIDNDSSARRAGTVQSALATRGSSPVFFTDIIHAVPAPRMTDSKPACHSPAVGCNNSTASSNSAGQPQGPVSILECVDEIDETLIACSTPSEDEIEFDEANADIYEDLDINEVCADSPPPNTPEFMPVPASRMPHAHSDDVTKGSEQLDTTLVASADAATKNACKSTASLSSLSPVKPADVLDIHLCVEDDRTFVSEVQSPSLLTKLTTSTVTGGQYSPVVHAKSATSTRTSESQCSAVLVEDPPRTSATLTTTSTPRTNCNLTRCRVPSAAPSPRHSRTGSPAQGRLKSMDQSPDFLQATVVKNLKTQNFVKLAAHSKVLVTNFLYEYKGGSSPGSSQSGPEVLAIDLEEGEVLSSPTNSPRANCNSKRAPVPSAAPSLRHSGTGLPAQRSLKSVDQLPNLLRATLVKNLKTQNSVKPAAHSSVYVTNFLDEYEGGSSPGSSPSDLEVLVIDVEEGEVLGNPTNSLSEGEIGDSSGIKDLRAKINAVRGLPDRQFKDKESRGKNIEGGNSPLGCSTTIDALCLEARQLATSSQAPETKIRDPFLSEDPAENLDNDNPAWEALRQLSTDEERYQHVHKVWRSSQIPDPHQELTTFHYRRRVAGLRSRVDTPAMKRGKRRASHEPSPSEGVGPIKRQRFDTDIFDLKLKELERKKEKDFTEAKDNLRRNLDRLHREERQGTRQRHYHHNEGWSQRHHHRAETAPADYHYWRMQERQMHEEFVANAQCINDKFSIKERQLLTARDEVHRFDAFYVGLHEDFDPRLLSESQLKQQLEAEKALGLFKLCYSPAQA